MSERWVPGVARFLLAFGVLAAAVGAVGLPLLPPEGRRGLLIAMVIAFGVQFLSVAVLAALRVGTTGYLVARMVAGLVRFVVIAVAAFALAGRDDVDLAVAMLTLTGLIFVLLLAETWMLRESRGTGDQRVTTVKS